MGRPSILVPLPKAVDDHQTMNARSLVAQGAAMSLVQSQLDAYLLGNLLRDFMAQPQRLAAMAAAAAAAATPDATRQAADTCEELMHV
jgi:UDP-N-acetylglucosamine--N-acetylmuramyl-(pentapeptide) pyrophosphoryl-undecaprenol N-acetylglucosamine transferase